MKPFCLSEFKIINEDLQGKIIGCRINNVSLLTSRDLVINCSMIKQEKLFISLNHFCPFVGLINVENSFSTLIGALNDNLRKFIKDAFILSVDLLTNDRIFKFELVKSNDLYEKENFFLYIECIPQRPNLIITDSNNKILFAMHYSSLNSSRSIVKGFEYIVPDNKLAISTCNIRNIQEIKNDMISLFYEALNNRNEEKYTELFKFLKIRIKSLNKKIITLNNSTLEAKEKLKMQEIGSMILALSNDQNELDSYIKENNLDFDEKMSPGINAEKYFKKYKKAKRTIEMNEIELNKTNEEIKNLEFALSSSPFLNEDELLSLAKYYVPHKYKIEKLKKSPSFIGSFVINNTKISYGKNAKANNELTFKIANPHDMYLHIKDIHGSHVIIHKENPTNEELLTACEVALLMSNKEDGDIYYTEVRNVKKGSSLGEANLLKYQIITLKNIRESTKRLLKN